MQFRRKFQRSITLAATLAVVTALLGACSATHFESTWKHPEANLQQLDGQKVAAFLISDNETTRRSIEDALARELTARGTRGVAGYTLMSTDTAKDEALAKKALEDAGVEAVVTLRIVSEDERTSTAPATWHQVPTYRNWGGYWVQEWRTVYEPGYTFTDKVTQVETLIYDMGSTGLIWAGLSRTVNPGDADRFVRELARATDDAIKKSGLLR